MKRRKIWTGAFLAALALPGVTLAQTCHSLTGSWKLNPEASRLGAGLSFNPHLRIDAIDLSLELTGDGLAQTWRLKGPFVDEADSYLTPVTGVTRPTNLHSALNFVPVAVGGRWENCTLVEEDQTFLFGQSFWTKSTFIVSPDDRRLTIHQVSVADLGDTERDLVFDRLPAKDAR